MKTPYSYSLNPSSANATEALGSLPHWSRISIPLAQTVRHTKALHAEFTIQQLSRKPFVVEAIEIKTLKSIDFSIAVKRKIILMYFLLEGNVTFTAEDGRIIAKVSSNQFFLTQNQPGTYYASYLCGRHTCLMITISKKWIREATSDFPTLSAETERFLTNNLFSATLPIIRMDKYAHTLIRELYTRVRRNIAALDGLLRLYMTYLLEHYNTLLESSRGLLAFEVKQYIDRNYTNTDFSIASLVKHFNVSAKTLQSQFRKSFHMTVHRYCIDLRLQLADALLREGKAIKDIYDLVGYSDIRSLRYAYTQRCRSKK